MVGGKVLRRKLGCWYSSSMHIDVKEIYDNLKASGMFLSTDSTTEFMNTLIEAEARIETARYVAIANALMLSEEQRRNLPVRLLKDLGLDYYTGEKPPTVG